MAKTRSTKRKPKLTSHTPKREKSFLNSTGALSTNPHAPKGSPPEPTPTSLINEATHLLYDQNQPFEALMLTTRVLQHAPTSLPALELLAEIHIELGDEDTARRVFEKAVELDPEGDESGPEKFLWLAQLGEGGAKMMGWYERGTGVLRRWIQARNSGEGKGKENRKGGDGDDGDERGLEGKLCSALCAMAEIYMSDLCDKPDAEERCERYVTEALLVVPTSPEALQTLASVQISQQRPDDAIAALQRSFSFWKDLDTNSPLIPSYASRFNLSKLLIETTQYETALEVLERLQLEDDQLPDLWYIGGWCLFLYGEQESPGSEERRELWESSREWLANCQLLYVALEWEDIGIREHTGELMQKITEELGEGEGEREGDVEGEGVGDEDEWESEDDMAMD